MLMSAAAPRAGRDTTSSRGTVSYIMFPKFSLTRSNTSLITGSPIRTPRGMPIAPMQTPSNNTALFSCFSVAPTDRRMPNWRSLSFREMVKELYIRKTEPSMIRTIRMPPRAYR